MVSQLTEEERRAMWSRILEAAMAYHDRSKAYGMQKVVATDAGLGTAAVSKWAKGLSRPEPATLRRLADLYGRSAAWLEDGSQSPDYGEFGTPDELLSQAADITEMVVVELLPDGTTAEFVEVMRRAHDLLLEGRGADEVSGILFAEVTRKKRQASANGA